MAINKAGIIGWAEYGGFISPKSEKKNASWPYHSTLIPLIHTLLALPFIKRPLPYTILMYSY